MSNPAKHRSMKKPRKPYPTFPLTAHNNGQWCKKIRGKVHFFGVWADPQAALDNYLRVAADLHAGKQPPQATLSPDTATVKDVCNSYLSRQLAKAQQGEIRASTFDDCRIVAECLARILGSARPACALGPADFQKFRSHIAKTGLAKRSGGLGPYGQARVISIVRSMFRSANESGLIDNVVKFGIGLAKPSATLKRRARQQADVENGKRLFEPADVLHLLQHAQIPLRAMILLGINGGMGNTDCARLPIKAVDLDRGVIEFDRPKTGIERAVPLWPETVEALRRALAARPKPTEETAANLVFLTAFGRLWVREHVHRTETNGIAKVVSVDAIGEEFNKLLRRLGLKRKGLGFYALRHTFRTWADEVRDQHAIHRIMGHAIPGMSGIYVEKISLERLRAVTEYVRSKLFAEPDTASSGPPSGADKACRSLDARDNGSTVA